MDTTFLLVASWIVIGLFIGYIAINKVKEKTKTATEKIGYKPKTKKPPMEFSKKILYAIFIVTAFLIVYTMFVVWHTSDTSPLNTLLIGLFAEVTAGTSFYYHKAGKENAIKLKGIYGQNETEHIEEEDLNEFNN